MIQAEMRQPQNRDLHSIHAQKLISKWANLQINES